MCDASGKSIGRTTNEIVRTFGRLMTLVLTRLRGRIEIGNGVLNVESSYYLTKGLT